LENAIKYSVDSPEIDVFTENVKDMILIKVTDKGLGMSKISQKEFFEKFLENIQETYIMLRPWFRFSICKKNC
jgi:signal transduction histidine kinase